MISQLAIPLAATTLCYVVLYAVRYIYREWTSPLRHIGGPKSPNPLLGNFKQLMDDPYLTDKWRREFGPNFRFKGLFNRTEFHTTDLKALNHIVTNSAVYQRAPFNREAAGRLLGKGLLTSELDVHHRHRRILNPAFGGAQIRDLTEIFIEKATQLRDIWAHEVELQDGKARVDILSWLRRATLDVIGAAAFGYQFNTLDTSGKPNELNEAFTTIFHGPRAALYAAIRTVQGMNPLLALLPLPGGKASRDARIKMDTIGAQIVADRKAEIKASEGEKGVPSGRDLLSVLLKANMSADLPESQRLSDSEVIGQIPAFFVAGHETTSLSTSWILHALSLNPVVQTRLREELFTIASENPTMDELNTLPYLEVVIRETMRIYSPVTSLSRMAMEDDVLPFSKPFIDAKGNSHDSLPIPKGYMLHIPILAVNTDPAIWGSDAAEFKPERWEKLPEEVSAIPGVWGNLITFYAGPHNCIGFRFSVAEMKALIFTLVRAFEFENAVPEGSIGRAAGTLQRPVVTGETKSESGLPLIVKSVKI
ncbi:cytochrome P450 [Mycena crocata]|nr:cytochrome P450 [Mycena crocata]